MDSPHPRAQTRSDTSSPPRRLRLRALATATLTLLALSVPSVAISVEQPLPSSVLASEVAETIGAGESVWVTAQALGLRSGDSSAFPVTVTGARDTRAVTTGNSAHGWIEVSMAGIEAWAPARFFTTAKPAWDPTRVMVTGALLGLRSGPSGSYDVVHEAPYGSEGRVTGVSVGDWWEVKIGGTFAWTPRRFLAVVEGTAPAAATQDVARQNVWVDANALGLRRGPSSDQKVVVTGYEDARARTTGEESDGWWRVDIGGIVAWAPARFLTADKPAWDPIRVRTTARSLGLRAEPFGSSPVIVTAPRDTAGIFTGVERNGWWEIKIDGRFAWTPSRFTSVGGLFDPSRVLDVAHAEVGYREPSWRDNKYNDWIGANNAWCAVFVAWVFDKSGYAAGVPKTEHFDDYVAELRASGVLDTTPKASELKKGDVLLIDWYPYNGPTHTAIVDHVEGNTVWTVEGNTSSGVPSIPGRGVWYRQRDLVDVYGWYRPTDYAFATR